MHLSGAGGGKFLSKLLHCGSLDSALAHSPALNLDGSFTTAQVKLLHMLSQSLAKDARRSAQIEVRSDLGCRTITVTKTYPPLSLKMTPLALPHGFACAPPLHD